MESVTALIRTTVQLQIVYLYSCESTLFSFCFVWIDCNEKIRHFHVWDNQMFPYLNYVEYPMSICMSVIEWVTENDIACKWLHHPARDWQCWLHDSIRIHGWPISIKCVVWFAKTEKKVKWQRANMFQHLAVSLSNE